MNVLLIDIDSKIPNLALKKIEKYHLDKCDEVTWNMPLAKNQSDKIYVSCIFTQNKPQAEMWKDYADVGGSGYSLDINLPPEIDSVLPRINYGFTTRGCIRKCEFCIVPRKEGKIHVVGDLLDLWDGKSKLITVMDNNILALPQHFEMVCKQAIENKIKLDFNQGLDHRLITKDIAELLAKISHAEYHLAFDNPDNVGHVDKAINILRSVGINRSIWYVLVGFNTTPEQDLFRLNYLREHNQNAYVQRYEHPQDLFYTALARWANQHHIFQGMSWDEFLKHPANKRYLGLNPR